MAKYNVIFTVRDKFGNEKELTGGTIDVDLATVTSDEATAIAGALQLDDYATDLELADAFKDVTTMENVKEMLKTNVIFGGNANLAL